MTDATIDQGQNNVLEGILMSDINDYRKMRSKYREQMHSIYAIMHASSGNLDQNIITLLETGPTYTEISIEHDPIELINLLRKLCWKEKGIEYALNTLIHSVVDRMTCKQGNDSIIDYVQTISLRMLWSPLNIVITDYLPLRMPWSDTIQRNNGHRIHLRPAKPMNRYNWPPWRNIV